MDQTAPSSPALDVAISSPARGHPALGKREQSGPRDYCYTKLIDASNTLKLRQGLPHSGQSMNAQLQTWQWENPFMKLQLAANTQNVSIESYGDRSRAVRVS